MREDDDPLASFVTSNHIEVSACGGKISIPHDEIDLEFAPATCDNIVHVAERDIAIVLSEREGTGGAGRPKEFKEVPFESV